MGIAGKKLLAAMFSIILAAVLFVAFPLPEPALAPTPEADEAMAGVDRVIDGDTLEADGRAIRLLGVDAPEKDRCFYAEARAELERLVLGQTIRLESDPLNADTDEYGRLLRYAYLPDGSLVNARLVAGGFARHLSWFPIERNEEFAALETAAREKAAGLWASCF